MSDAILRYTRTGGRPPVDHEVLDVAVDGSFTLWRSMAIASNPPSPVGAFAGRTDAGAVEAAVASVGATTTLPLPAGASRETVRAGGAEFGGPNDGRVPEDWRACVTLARTLLGELTSSPVAALALRADPFRLEHLGTDALRADAGHATVRTVTWDGPAVTGATESALVLEQDELAPGWSLTLDVGATSSVTVEVNGLRLFDGAEWHDVALSLHVD